MPAPEPARSPSEARRDEDRRLVDAVTDGSDVAWASLLERYSRLIQASARRWTTDPEEARDLYAEVLERLRSGGLATWEGRSSLATWLVVVCRSVGLDRLRRDRGRRGRLKGLEELDSEQREVFRLFYLDGWSFEAVCHRLGNGNESESRPRVVAALRAIHARIPAHVLDRLSYDLAARSVGEVSGRLLRYLVEARTQASAHARAETPETQMMRQEAMQRAQRILDHLETLSPEEREAVDLRYHRGWTAREIAERRGVPTRQVFTVLERVRRLLKRAANRIDTTLEER